MDEDESFPTIPTEKEKHHFNGYTLFWTEAMKSRLPLPNETGEACRKRIMRECQQQWSNNSEEAAEMRRTWSAKAKVKNLERKATMVPSANHGQKGRGLVGSLTSVVPHFDDTPKTLGNLMVPSNSLLDDNQETQGFGPMMLGDKSWAISEQLVETVETNTKSFVDTYSSRWKQRSGNMVSSNEPFNHATVQSCLEQFGFCKSEIHSFPMFQHVREQFRNYVRTHRRKHLDKGQNTGPKISIQHPLLILKASHESDTQCKMGGCT